jgi:hypothetical protein
MEFAFLITIYEPSLVDEPDLRPASNAITAGFF